MWKNVYAYFVDLEKAFDLVPQKKLWAVLRKYDVNGHLLLAVLLRNLCPRRQR